ncbi:DUF2871 domain-containing protein [Staphylococcus felis]|uniref:DUF2871 domain-containing protein n=1 Tax=Staphylococcus felis TaxID=46127 RepID=UPI000E232F34|nr:DUF2871 domain-containing protein [Staphylococcus felis]REI11575.1 hypothetical protein DOS66_03765 [Staphylococcus felis]REI16437.1 hypothetical protein DOS73_03180 [Staphylococcus felis]
MKRILYAFMVYTMLGLFSGFLYRELTLHYHYTGETQMSVLHTHLLTLGMFMFLILIPIEKLFKLSSYYLFNWFFIIYNLGVIITVGMQFAKGFTQISGQGNAAALSGFAGIGHVIITAGFILLFFLLRQAIIKEPKDHTN